MKKSEATIKFHECLNSKNLSPIERLTIAMHYNVLELSVKENTEMFKMYKEIMEEVNAN